MTDFRLGEFLGPGRSTCTKEPSVEDRKFFRPGILMQLVELSILDLRRLRPIAQAPRM